MKETIKIDRKQNRILFLSISSVKFRRVALIALFLIVFINQRVLSQQQPQYSQFVFNSFLINPAIAGIENYIDVKSGYRKQWQGIEGAPETSFFSIQAPLGKEFGWNNANSFLGAGSNPMARSYLPNYQASAPHHGVGLTGYVDKAGAIQTVDFNIVYAYHLGLAPKLNLAVGVSGGIESTVFNKSDIEDAENADRVTENYLKGQLSPNLGAGLWLYSPRIFAGLSGQQLLGGLSGSGNNALSVKRVPHYYLTLGYKFYVAEEIFVMSSILLKKVGPADIATDLNSKITFKGKFWLGGSYRKDNSLSAMTGFYVNHLVNIGYAYDFDTSELQKVAGGTHEIILGLLLNNRYKVPSSIRNW